MIEIDYPEEFYLASLEAKKGNNMNTEVQNTQPVEMTPEQIAKFKQAAEQLQRDGEVLVQTSEDVGTETPATVH